MAHHLSAHCYCITWTNVLTHNIPKASALCSLANQSCQWNAGILSENWDWNPTSKSNSSNFIGLMAQQRTQSSRSLPMKRDTWVCGCHLHREPTRDASLLSVWESGALFYGNQKSFRNMAARIPSVVPRWTCKSQRGKHEAGHEHLSQGVCFLLHRTLSTCSLFRASFLACLCGGERCRHAHCPVKRLEKGSSPHLSDQFSVL